MLRYKRSLPKPLILDDLAHITSRPRLTAILEILFEKVYYRIPYALTLKVFYWNTVSFRIHPSKLNEIFITTYRPSSKIKL